jgi:hypothetical protein
LKCALHSASSSFSRLALATFMPPNLLSHK